LTALRRLVEEWRADAELDRRKARDRRGASKVCLLHSEKLRDGYATRLETELDALEGRMSGTG